MNHLKKAQIPLAAACLLFLITTACNNDHQEPEVDLAEAPELLVPNFINEDGDPVFSENRLWLQDYSNYLHAIQLMATVSRESEYGSEAYRPDLFPDEMIRRAEQWLDLVRTTDHRFNEEGRFATWLEEVNGGYFKSDSVDLSVYPHLVYAYHIHHRSGRFDFDDTLFNRLNREATNFLVTPGQYLMNEHFRGGRFVHDDGSFDHRSMSYGLGGIHANAYSWIVWKKPGGADDMGVIEEEVLEHWMGHSTDEMVQIYRELAETMDEAWLEEYSIYDFGDGTEWHLDAVGAMIRGKKAMYDFLYMFGDDEDEATARLLFDRTAAMFESVVPLIEPWGLPQQVEFTENGTMAASEEVILYNWYQFLNHIGGAYAFDREREGMPMYLTELREDLFDVIGDISDKALQGSLDYHLNENGRLMTSVNFSDGSPMDERLGVSTAGMFITMAANMYRKGSAFERASDWDSVTDDVAERSRALYDLKFHLMELLDQAVSSPDDLAVSD